MAEYSPALPAPPDPHACDLGTLLEDAWARVPVGLCLTDQAGAIWRVNPAFCSITGYPADELLGMSVVRLHSAEAAIAASATHAAIIAGQPVSCGAIYLHKNGRPLFAHVTDTRVIAGSGERFRLTFLVCLEREARRDSRLEQLQRAGRFVNMAGTICNDFNNLLAIMLGYTAFLQEAGGDPRRIQTAARGIENAVQRAAALIKQTVHLTQQTAPVLQKLDLSFFAEELSRSIAASAEWSLQVELALQRDLPPTLLDPRHLNQMLTDLCRRAMEIEGVNFRVRLATLTIPACQLEPRFPEAGEPLYVMLEVRFMGQVHGARRTGAHWENRRDLALVAMESVMANHGGCCERLIVEDGDASFRLYFPALPEPEPAGAADGLEAGARPQRTILIVEDEEPLLHSLGFALEHHGCRVLKARDGAEAVALHHQHVETIELVLCDLGLPGMSGWEAFMKMREASPGVRVVFMSRHLEPTLHAEVLRAGAKGFLRKPFSIAAAVGQVSELLDSARIDKF